MNSFRLNESADSVSYLVCEPLEKVGFVHAFSTRLGGISPMPEGDLNLAYRDDAGGNVDENRRRFLSAMEIQRPLVTCHQTHSVRYRFLNKSHNPSGPELDCDALATDRADVLIGVKTADCVPVLVGDPASGVSVALHAGWRGALGRVVEKTIDRLKAQHLFTPSLAVAAVGPSACVDCYDVGPEVQDAFRKEFPYAEDLFQKNHLDVALANVRQLLQAGLSPANIYVSQYCTMRDNKLFFSHRREGSNASHPTGRMLAVIGKK